MQKETRTIKAQTTVTFSPVTTIIESVVTVTATVDGVEYTIPNVQLRKLVQQLFLNLQNHTQVTITVMEITATQVVVQVEDNN